MRILLATDGSDSAGVGADLVAGIDWPSDTSVRVVEAIETGPAIFGGPWPAIALAQIEALETDVREAARATVAAACDRLARPGLHVTSAVVAGRPATAVVEAARTMDADLIVVGSRGHGTIESMLLGSVSSEVVDHSPVSVLIARRASFRRIVLAWDGSASARVAADIVRTWPIFRGSAVRVVSVADFEIPWWTGVAGVESPALMPMYADAAEASRRSHAELARDMTGELAATGASATAEAREGDAATEIIASAAAWDADLIVLGTHGRTGLRRLLLGSVARNVLQHSGTSVLIARESPSRSDGLRGDIA